MEDKTELVKAQNRIVVGDVGSGKTMIGFFVAAGFLNGIEITKPATVAIVAPTEILASQHYENLIKFVEQNNLKDTITTIYVSGKQYKIDDEKFTKAKFEKALESLNGKHIIWMGTHALFHREDVLPDLVMIDEQHRFGVKQRQELTQRLDQQGRFAHFVSFSATPIPRTMALMVYKDLQPLFLETLKKRNPIATTKVHIDRMDPVVIPAIQEALNNSRKIYIVCPRVEDEDTSDLWSIKQAETYFKKHFGDTIITIHGKAKNKDKTIEEFRDNPDKNILISTTVIEVGVDVSEATVMIILNAERFGLAALHQIRGRVGRNGYENNQCFLVAGDAGIYSKRLQYLVESQDGFYLAQKDLELRGGGDLTGKLQSGYTEDLEIFMNTDQSEIEKVTDLVNDLDWTNLTKDLPRLQSYLDSQLIENWGE